MSSDESVLMEVEVAEAWAAASWALFGEAGFLA